MSRPCGCRRVYTVEVADILAGEEDEDDFDDRLTADEFRAGLMLGEKDDQADDDYEQAGESRAGGVSATGLIDMDDQDKKARETYEEEDSSNR